MIKSFPFYAVLAGCVSVGLGMNAAIANNKIGQENSVSQATARGEEFIVRGNEPFWNVTINRSGIIYSTPEINRRRYPYTAPMRAEGRPADLVRVYRLNGQPSGLLVIRKVDACSDTMSDIVYPYNATLILGNRVLEGCAQKR
jgi:uncharacterized membrane protein